MLVETSRFGRLEASQEDAIIFPQGLIGFESSRNWILIPDPANSDVAWLQSLSEARVALPVISPRKFVNDYKVTIASRDLSPLATRSSDRIYVLCVVSKSGKTLTMNLRSPIIVNLTRRLACQVITSEVLPISLPFTLDRQSSVRAAA